MCAVLLGLAVSFFIIASLGAEEIDVLCQALFFESAPVVLAAVAVLHCCVDLWKELCWSNDHTA